MDLNDLFYLQQIERSRADAAPSDEARELHEGLARKYEGQIVAARKPDAGTGSLFQWRNSRADPQVNATMAVAITAREVERPDLALEGGGSPLSQKDQVLSRS